MKARHVARQAALALALLALAGCAQVIAVKPGSDLLATGRNERRAGEGDVATIWLRAAVAAAESEAMRNRARHALAGALLSADPSPPSPAEIDEGLSLLEQAALTSPQAARDLGVILAEGQFVSRDDLRAERLLREAATSDAPAALLLGRYIEAGRFQPRATGEAEALIAGARADLTRRSEAGDAQASRRLADDDLADARNPARGETYLIRAVEQGDPGAILRLADFWAERDGDAGAARAEALLTLALANGDARPAVRRRLGDLKRDAGDLDAALGHYLAVADVDPGFSARRIASVLAMPAAQDLPADRTRPALAVLGAAADTDPDVAVALGQLAMAGAYGPPDAARAVRLYRMAADAGSARGAVLYGRALRDGTTVPADPAAAFRHFRQAADQNEPSAWRDLAGAYAKGEGVSPDPAAARRYYLLAARDGGSAAAAHELAELLRNGLGGPRDEAEALRWDKVAAEGGSVAAMRALAAAYRRGSGAEPDQSRATDWLKRAADHGSRAAQYDLAWAHAAGRGTPRNVTQAEALFERLYKADRTIASRIGSAYATGAEGARNDRLALKWLTRAGQNGDATAIRMLARSYENAGGDLKAARAWRQRAAALGDAPSMEWLGDAAFEGRFGPPDMQSAERWYAAAAKAGAPAGAIRLAKAHTVGAGALSDPEAAFAWWLRAAEAGAGEAQFQVGMAYLAGIGVTQDAKQADRWLTAARAAGFVADNSASR